MITWYVVYIIALSLSAISAITMVFQALRWTKILQSAAQFVIFFIFVCDFCWASCRIVYYALLINQQIKNKNESKERAYGPTIWDHYIPNHGFEYSIQVLSEAFLLGSAVWIIVTTYELRRVVFRSETPRKTSEWQMILKYLILVIFMVIPFTIFASLIPQLFGDNFDQVVYLMEIFVQIIAFISLIYSVLFFRIYNKKMMEVDNSAKPVLNRLRRLLVSSAVCGLPFCIVMVVYAIQKFENPPLVEVSTCIFYLMGAANSMAMGASQFCCLKILFPCMPKDLRDEILLEEVRDQRNENCTQNLRLIIDPPKEYPVFVCTDIVSSTMLWAQAPDAMSIAHAVHDSIIREGLIRFRGYEITTCGDAFQLAFHSVHEAIEFCVSTQILFRETAWPKEISLSSILNKSNRKQGSRPTIKDIKLFTSEYTTSNTVHDTGSTDDPQVYDGLRVRMGIHVGDKHVISQTHPVTGRTTYSGVSEIVAREIGDADSGAQILMSEEAHDFWCNESFTNNIQYAPKYEVREIGEKYFVAVDMSILLFKIIPLPESPKLRYRTLSTASRSSRFSRVSNVFN